MIMRFVHSVAFATCVSCSRAPSFDIFGSFFPAWLLCLALGVVVTIVCRSFLLSIRIPVFLPVVTYPSLTVLLTLAFWLTWFR